MSIHWTDPDSTAFSEETAGLVKMWSGMLVVAIVAIALTLTLAEPKASSPVGASWDGTPPGTFADLVGTHEIAFGHPDFPAGMWLITVDGGYTITSDIVGFEGDTVCAAMANACTLGRPDINPVTRQRQPTALQVYLDRPWRLWASTPTLFHAVSSGPQFAFVQTSPTTWRWGLEDIALPGGDGDFQDAFGTLTFLGAGR